MKFNFSPLIVMKLDQYTWEVVQNMYVQHDELTVTVPIHFKTDFASTPRFLWAFFPPYGKYTEAAVLHDYLYAQKLFSRAKADKIFYYAMLSLDVPKWKAKAMYQAVRMFGQRAYSQK